MSQEEKRTEIVVFAGPPGAGKGTLASMFAKKYPSVETVGTGKLFRSLDLDTKVGREVKAIMDAGKYVSDQQTLDLLDLNMPNSSVVILDGYPRTVKQTESLRAYLTGWGEVKSVVWFETSSDDIWIRLTGRLSCSKDSEHGGGYNRVTKKPKKEGICDECKAVLEVRSDSGKLMKRLEEYFVQTLPVKQIYKDAGLLIKADASKRPEEIFRTLEKKFTKIINAH